MAAGAETLKRTPLYDRHVAAGARLVPFAGWEMPVQYAGIREEHVAVRDGVGVFDVSHMGEVETTGRDAERFLQRVLSNDVRKIAIDGAQYSVMCRENGGVLDDLFTYRHGSGFLTVTNAANHERDLAWMRGQARGYDVTVHDRLHDYAMLAVQGPRARDLVAGLADGELPKRFRTAELTVAGAPGVLVCGTGYTGEDGVELLIAPDQATRVWDALLEAGARPAGRRAAGGPAPAEKLAAFAMTGPGIARQGNAVEGGGVVTSGTMSPCLDVGIGMAYLPAGKAEPGTPIEIDVRGKRRTAEVRAKPLYSKER